MSTIIPLPDLGIDLLSDETQLPAGAVRSAVNVDIDKRGQFSRRSGSALAVPGDGFDNLYPYNGVLIARRGRTLVSVDPDTMAVTELCDLGASRPIDFTEHNGALYAVSPKGLFVKHKSSPTTRRAGSFTPPSLPDIVPSETGGLTPGRYIVAVSMCDESGEESPAVVIGQVETSAGFRLTGLAVAFGRKWRVYMTPPDGDVLYLSEEFDAVFSQYAIGTYPNGAKCETLNLAHMPGGHLVRSYASRLYVASGDTLWYSEPFRPHLTTPHHNFIRFVGEIRFIEFVGGGLYVGDDRGVWWMAGDDPTQYKQVLASQAVAVPRSSLTLLASHLGALGAASRSATPHAVWLSADGYMVGTPGGEAIPIHPDRVRLVPDAPGQSVFLLRDGRQQILTLTATSGLSAVPGHALDTRH